MKKTKPKVYLKLYKKLIRDGKLTHCGLCSELDLIKEPIVSRYLTSFSKVKLSSLFIPKDRSEKQDLESLIYWGYGVIGDEPNTRFNSPLRWYKFTKLRQNLLLLMAAVNNEL